MAKHEPETSKSKPAHATPAPSSRPGTADKSESQKEQEQEATKGRSSDERREAAPETDTEGNKIDPKAGPQTVDPELSGAKGEHGGALAHHEKDVQTEEQVKAGGRADRNQIHEYIDVGAGRVQRTTPNNDPAK